MADFPRALGHPCLACSGTYKDHNTVNMADFLRALDHPRLQRNLQRRQYSNNDDITVKMADFLWALGTPASQ